MINDAVKKRGQKNNIHSVCAGMAKGNTHKTRGNLTDIYIYFFGDNYAYYSEGLSRRKSGGKLGNKKCNIRKLIAF